MTLSTFTWHLQVRSAASSPAKLFVAPQTRSINSLRLAGRLMSLSTLSWNIAAVNNNPFEYFLTHPDPKYISLMEGVEGFIEAPGEHSMKNSLP